MILLPRTIGELLASYRSGALAPREVMAVLRGRCPAGDPAWILRCDEVTMEAQLSALDPIDPRALPLYGVPFVVDDSFDVQGLPTTAGCPAASRIAARSAAVVHPLVRAGAVLLGKTNLDQFAAGATGTRSPHGAVPNSFDPERVCGGASAGSASVVTRGLAAFALGADPAGGGGVPAGFNNIVSFKPTPGRLSTRGLVPSCRSLDGISVFALSVRDTTRVLKVIEGNEGEAVAPASPPGLGRLPQPVRVGVPRRLADPVDTVYAAAFERALEDLRDLGALVKQVDLQPHYETAQLLLDGPWLAERYAALQALVEREPEALDPAVRQLVEAARRFDAAAVFRAQYRRSELAQRAQAVWQEVDVLMLPSASTLPTLAAAQAAPLAVERELGRYCGFANLLGMAVLSVPAGFTMAGLPYGVSFVGPGGSDALLAQLGARWQASLGLPLGFAQGRAELSELCLGESLEAEPVLALAVAGAHLAGMPLHHQLAERRCRLLLQTRTAPRYRLYALGDGPAVGPGLTRVADGAPIEVEVYEMPLREVGAFLAGIVPPLGLGSVELEDGRTVHAVVCEAWAVDGAEDITAWGGWRAYLWQSRGAPRRQLSW
ncbi:allophanate hydrolase [Aquabacterium sp. A7-Y]|uniref:allophanate hydrolase n=1 Tax=Aquabacterium sp. A7-Y TaxID=1349605 RepID=UPI00223DBDCD|nr:allophanate hydrolase [Aquabacterium sp. A7-Y]MCW7538486.1 allophanate hydrolase [Aquabacterium sp. A7-Y]